MSKERFRIDRKSTWNSQDLPPVIYKGTLLTRREVVLIGVSALLGCVSGGIGGVFGVEIAKRQFNARLGIIEGRIIVHENAIRNQVKVNDSQEVKIRDLSK